MSDAYISLGNSMVKIPLPKPYDGEFNATRLDSWVAQVSHLFTLNGIESSEDKVLYAAAFLTDDAAIWYQDYGQKRADTWENFVTLLRQEFYPPNYEQDLRIKFDGIHQTDSVRRYAEDFLKLYRKFPTGYMTDWEAKHHYIKGLKSELNKATLQYRSTTLKEAISHSYFAEDVMTGNIPIDSRRRQINEDSDEKLVDKITSRYHLSSDSHSSRTSPPESVDAFITEKEGISKLTPDERSELLRLGGCFRCRKLGHIASKCPKGVCP